MKIRDSIASVVKSASKVVFIMLAASACAAFFLGKLDQNNFMLLAGAAFTFYFSNKGEVKNTDYAGK